MTYFINAIWLLAILPSAYAQKYSSTDLAKMVVAIGDNRPNGHSIVGTGIIIRDSTRYYLLTAAHVSDSIKGECNLVFSTSNDLAVSIPLKKFTTSINSKWKNHFEADISYIELRPFNADTQSHFRVCSFPKKQMFCKMKAISVDTDVLAIGFPAIDVVGLRFSPFQFHSKFAGGLISLYRGDTRKSCVFQLLQNPSVQGYSGGPVLVGYERTGATVGPKQTVLVGIMHGTFPDNTGGKMAMVTPSVYICDLLK